jgi:hypothetical protein
MSDRALSFLENWIDRNILTPIFYMVDEEMRETLTRNCINDAEKKGISRQEIEEEIGDLAAFLGETLEHGSEVSDPMREP